MLSQMARGLQIFEVLKEMTNNKEQMRKLFTSEGYQELTAESILGLLKVTFSDAQKRKESEMCTYKAFRDFIHMIEYEGIINIT